MERDSRTGSVLFRVLRDRVDNRAWEAFVDRYVPNIFGWCRRWGLQHADAQNVTQEVLTRLFQKLPAFTYDPEKGTFRSWLKTLAHHAWSDYREGQQRGGEGRGDTGVEGPLDTLEARGDLLATLEEAFDLELLEEAQIRVQRQVSPRDWRIFQAVALEGRPGPEVARELQINDSAVRMAKCRVQQRLREEVCRLEQAGPDFSEGEP